MKKKIKTTKKTAIPALVSLALARRPTPGLVSLALTVMLTTMTLSSRRAGVKLAEFRVGYYDGTPADVGSKNGPLLDLSMPMCGKCFFASAL